MNQSAEQQPAYAWLDRPVFRSLPQFRVETLLVILILFVAVFSRFYILGNRVMSHDEVNHVVPSWELFTGQGYRHDPITHGPLQFHLVALTYFIFGDNDFTSRIPAALFSIATVAFVLFAFRRYLGRVGSLIAGFLFLISPYILFYGRYTRNEAFIALYAVITLYAVLKYLEKGHNWTLFLLTAVVALHFITKETAFIYTAQILLFLAFLFMERVSRARWPKENSRSAFLILMAGALLLLIITLGLAAYNAAATKPPAGSETAPVASAVTSLQIIEAFTLLGALALGVLAIVVILRSIGWNNLKQERSFDLLILVGSLILPQLTAFPIELIGKYFGLNWNPLDYTAPGIIRSGAFLVVIFIISAVIGLLWKPKLWLANFALFYSIFTVFYTTFFTNGVGFFTGIIGSLGYWLEQQSVQRGSQPWYFYALIQIPVYEYLAAFGTLLALYFGLRHNKLTSTPNYQLADEEEKDFDDSELVEIPQEEHPSEAVIVEPEQEEPAPAEEDQPIFSQTRRLPVLILLLFWSVTALIAYSLAGEKMPWLTVHIAVPMLLAAGWGFGYLFETMPWSKLKENRSWIAILILPVFIAALFGTLGTLLSKNPPFQGNTLDQLESTTTFIFSLLALIFSGIGLVRFLMNWGNKQIVRLATLVVFAILSVLTIRTSITSSYINYDTAKEFLVYAHSASGPKEILAQVEEISRRTTGGLDINVAYVDDALYPYWWYLRDYPNKRWVPSNPTRDLQDSPLIIAGDANVAKVDSITKGKFIHFDYMRLWWPMQDYYNLTWERIWSAISNPEMRAAIFQIWLNRDYTEYAKLTNNPNLTLETWQPSAHLRFYIRNDIVSQIWNYGVAPTLGTTEQLDPYAKNMITLMPDQVIGAPGSEPGQLNAPRGVAVAPDGSIYVADSRNNRIQHFSADGAVLHTWGSFADAALGSAPGGTFNEPWGVAVAPDGSVFVADTWNHRIQKFAADGQFIQMWGFFGQAETPDAFWGPREIAFDPQGRLYVTDTGNKRVVIFDQNGTYISQFGSVGFDPGQFDEEVGIAINAEGEIYIADTWNQRIQVFTFDAATNQAIYLRSWDVSAWSGQSIDNKPYIAVDSQNHVYITDPEAYRVLEFSSTGEFLRGWGSYSPSSDGFGLPVGITVDAQDHVWVSDSGNNTILRFTVTQ